MNKKDRYIVELVRPAGVTHTAMCYFIRDAVRAEVGAQHPSNRLSDLQRNTVKVKSFGRVMTAHLRSSRTLRP